MNRKLIGTVAVLAAIAFAAYMGLRDGREHRNAAAQSAAGTSG